MGPRRRKTLSLAILLIMSIASSALPQVSAVGVVWKTAPTAGMETSGFVSDETFTWAK